MAERNGRDADHGDQTVEEVSVPSVRPGLWRGMYLRRFLAPFTRLKSIGLYLGPLLFVLMLVLDPPAGMEATGRAVAATTVWMAVWWTTEAVPIPVTALLPLVLFPLSGALGFQAAAASYSDSNIMLFLGGFMLAAAIQKWNLHRRIALVIVALVGTRPERLILGFMAATGFLSMWISNTATAMMMLPIGLAVVGKLASLADARGMEIKVEAGLGYGQVLMLSIAYSATIGGVATLIGTPPNAIFAGALNRMYGIKVSFAEWMVYGLPIALLFMGLAWLLLTRTPAVRNLRGLEGGKEVVTRELAEMGPLSGPEARVLAVFVLVAGGWILRGFVLARWLPTLNDAMLAIIGAILLFVVPAGGGNDENLLDWESALGIPWGILLLFGGGICIAAGFMETGLATWIGQQMGVLEGAHLLLVLAAVVTLVIFLTEVTSNTGTTSVMMPVMVALALAMQVHPIGLMITATTAASFAFMLPVATPPNAVVFASGYLTIPEMARAGLRLNLLGIVIITAVAYLWLPLAWGIDLTTFVPGF